MAGRKRRRVTVTSEQAAAAKAIFEFWASRSCIPEGEAVRNVTADFITEVIQHSEHPAPSEEIEKANEKQRCPEAEALPIESTATP